MQISDAVLITVETIFFTFHFSVLFVLIIYQKNKFPGAFYNMLRLLFASDILFFITAFGSKIPAFGFFRNFFETDTIVAKLEQIVTIEYLVPLQFLIQTFISFNRFTAFWFPFSYKKIWKRQWYSVVILIIPIFKLIPWILEPARFVYSQNALVFLTYVNKDSETSNLYLTFVFSCLTTFFAAIFNLLAVIKHFIHKYKSPNLIQLKEITFLYMSCILFFIHLIFCLIIIGRTFFKDNVILAFLLQGLTVITIDIIAWCGSISLLFVSKFVRKTYLCFYLNLFKRKNQISLKVQIVQRNQSQHKILPPKIQ